MTADEHSSTPPDPKWEVVGYTDTGDQICEDRFGQRWVTKALFPPVDEVSFTDTELLEFLAGDDGRTYQPEEIEDRRWTTAHLAALFTIPEHDLDDMIRRAGITNRPLTIDDYEAFVAAHWVDPGPRGVTVWDVVSDPLEHTWVPLAVAAPLLGITEASLEVLIGRAERGDGLPHAVLADLGNHGRRLDVTATRAVTRLTGPYLRRILGSPDPQTALQVVLEVSPDTDTSR